MMRKVHRAGRIEGSVRVPGDKSGSHRALMLSALAGGESTISGLSEGHDVVATSNIVCQLGASRYDDNDLVHVVGPVSGLQPSTTDLDCTNSGTTMRLMAGITASLDGQCRLVGDASLSQRPMDRVAHPLQLMGALVSGVGDRVTAPLLIRGRPQLRAVHYVVPTASAQVKSSILLAALVADGVTTVVENIRTRPTSEEMLRRAGVRVESVDEQAGRKVSIWPGRPRATHWVIPGDPSQAAFFVVLAAIHEDANLRVLEVDNSRERVGFLTVLERMGADLVRHLSDSRATLEVRSSSLTATEIHSSEIPSVDEVPILTVAAAAAQGTTAFLDMGELRLKESDRFEGSLALARALGCHAWSEGENFYVDGLGSAGAFSPFEIDAGLDHRMVMSSAVAGVAGHGCTIVGADTVSSSYPRFFDDLEGLR